MTDDEIAAMRELAEHFLPGLWTWFGAEAVYSDGMGTEVVLCAADEDSEIGLYAATFCPATVVQLLDALDALRRVETAARAYRRAEQIMDETDHTPGSLPWPECDQTYYDWTTARDVLDAALDAALAAPHDAKETGHD